jgi:probable addiction module antidote protein
MSDLTRLDVSDHLTDDDIIIEYLCAAAEDENTEVFIAALGEVAKARGMTDVARATGLGRESLYKSLSTNGRPGFATVNAVLRALGLRFTVTVQDSAGTLT